MLSSTVLLTLKSTQKLGETDRKRSESGDRRLTGQQLQVYLNSNRSKKVSVSTVMTWSYRFDREGYRKEAIAKT